MDGETEKAKETPIETPYERGVRMADDFIRKQVGEVGLERALERMRIERDSVAFFAKESLVNKGMYDAYSDFQRRHVSGVARASAEWMDRVSKLESSSQSSFLF